MPSSFVSAGTKCPFRGWLKILLLAAMLCSFTRAAVAATPVITISLIGTTTNFGTLQKPLSGSNSYTVDYNGSGSGSGTLLYGITTKGQYKITCVSSCAGNWNLTIDIQGVNSGNANVTISNFTGLYTEDTGPPTIVSSFPTIQSKPTLGNNGGNGSYAYLDLGTTATYNSSVPVGTLTPTFNIVTTP